MIELKAINEFTDSPIHTFFLDYLSEESLADLENSFAKEISIMKKQAELNNQKPLKLIQVDNINRNYDGTFKDEKNNLYVLMSRDGNCNLTYYDKEPVCDIKVPVEICGKIINCKYSFWLSSGSYKIEDFREVLNKEFAEEQEEII